MQQAKPPFVVLVSEMGVSLSLRCCSTSDPGPVFMWETRKKLLVPNSSALTIAAIWGVN